MIRTSNSRIEQNLGTEDAIEYPNQTVIVFLL